MGAVRESRRGTLSRSKSGGDELVSSVAAVGNSDVDKKEGILSVLLDEVFRPSAGNGAADCT